MGFSRPYICPQEAATSLILLLATLLVMFDPPKVRNGQKTKLLCGFFRSEFASFCLFWHLNLPRPAAQWVQPNFFGPEGGQTIPPHHSIAKYLKNLKLISQTGTFILRHCVNLYQYPGSKFFISNKPRGIIHENTVGILEHANKT